MSTQQVALIAEKAAFRPRSRLWELHELHVPFDVLTGEGAYERCAIARITEGSCVAVIGPSGAGKSSVIAWLCYQLPPTHFALRIPVTAVEVLRRLTQRVRRPGRRGDARRRANAPGRRIPRVRSSRAGARAAHHPLLGDQARHALHAILARRAELAAPRVRIADVIEEVALDELAEFYRHSSGDLRRVLAAAHEVAEHAATDQAQRIALPHARYGIAQWQ